MAVTGLKVIMDKLEVNENDSNKTAFLKGAAEGAIQGLVIIGAVAVVQNLTGIKLLTFRKG